MKTKSQADNLGQKQYAIFFNRLDVWIKIRSNFDGDFDTLRREFGVTRNRGNYFSCLKMKERLAVRTTECPFKLKIIDGSIFIKGTHTHTKRIGKCHFMPAINIGIIINK